MVMSLRQKDVERAVDADLIIENGLGLERWARRFVSAAGDVPTVTLTEGMEPLLIDGDGFRSTQPPRLDVPRRAQSYVDQIVEALSRLDQRVWRFLRPMLKPIRLSCELREILTAIPEKQRVLVSCEGPFLTWLRTMVLTKPTFGL